MAGRGLDFTLSVDNYENELSQKDIEKISVTPSSIITVCKKGNVRIEYTDAPRPKYDLKRTALFSSWAIQENLLYISYKDGSVKVIDIETHQAHVIIQDPALKGAKAIITSKDYVVFVFAMQAEVYWRQRGDHIRLHTLDTGFMQTVRPDFCSFDHELLFLAGRDQFQVWKILSPEKALFKVRSSGRSWLQVRQYGSMVFASSVDQLEMYNLAVYNHETKSGYTTTSMSTPIISMHLDDMGLFTGDTKGNLILRNSTTGEELLAYNMDFGDDDDANDECTSLTDMNLQRAITHIKRIARCILFCCKDGSLYSLDIAQYLMCPPVKLFSSGGTPIGIFESQRDGLDSCCVAMIGGKKALPKLATKITNVMKRVGSVTSPRGPISKRLLQVSHVYGETALFVPKRDYAARIEWPLKHFDPVGPLQSRMEAFSSPVAWWQWQLQQHAFSILLFYKGERDVWEQCTLTEWHKLYDIFKLRGGEIYCIKSLGERKTANDMELMLPRKFLDDLKSSERQDLEQREHLSITTSNIGEGSVVIKSRSDPDFVNPFTNVVVDKHNALAKHFNIVVSKHPDYTREVAEHGVIVQRADTVMSYYFRVDPRRKYHLDGLEYWRPEPSCVADYLVGLLDNRKTLTEEYTQRVKIGCPVTHLGWTKQYKLKQIMSSLHRKYSTPPEERGEHKSGNSGNSKGKNRYEIDISLADKVVRMQSDAASSGSGRSRSARSNSEQSSNAIVRKSKRVRRRSTGRKKKRRHSAKAQRRGTLLAPPSNV